MIYSTLQHGEHTFREVILDTLGFHMCSLCLSTLIPFFSLKERQIRFVQIDLVSGRAPSGRNDLIPYQEGIFLVTGRKACHLP